MKVTILDDYHDTLRALECFARLADHDVDVWTDHVEDVDALAERLRDTEALVLIRVSASGHRADRAQLAQTGYQPDQVGS